MGFAVWIDPTHRLAWAKGTHEYRPMGVAAIALSGQLRHSDFLSTRRIPARLATSFAGFFGSLETVNEFLQTSPKPAPRATPLHLL